MKFTFLPVVLVVFLWFVPSYSFASTTSQQIPYKRMSDDSTSFTGVEHNTNKNDNDHITIGLFVPSSPDDKIGRAIVDAAQLVITEANLNGGYNGIPFRISHRWTETPWTAGPSEILKLVYQDKAVAIITSLSAASHIAAQIAVKTYIPVISIASSDATLTQARVPWIFRLPADDQKQAEILLETCISRGVCQAGLISTTDQDSRIGAKNMVEEFERQNTTPLFHFQVNANDIDWDDLIDRIAAQAPTVLFIRTTAQIVIKITSLLQKEDFIRPIFLSWTPGLDIADLANSYPGKIFSLSPISEISRKVLLYNNKETTHSNLLPVHHLAVDGIQMAVTSIVSSGPNRSSIRKTLAEIKVYQGVSGRYNFDSGGANTSPPTLMEFH